MYTEGFLSHAQCTPPSRRSKKRVPKLGVNQLRVYEMNKYGKLANNAVLRWLLVKVTVTRSL